MVEKAAPMLTVWRCQKCKILNTLDSSECTNKANGSKICDFDLQMSEEDTEPDFLEMTEAEFRSKVKEWQRQYELGKKQKEKEEQEKKLNDDDWICSNCDTKNKMEPGKYESCLC